MVLLQRQKRIQQLRCGISLKEIQYSRCGRTDKEASAVGQLKFNGIVLCGFQPAMVVDKSSPHPSPDAKKEKFKGTPNGSTKRKTTVKRHLPLFPWLMVHIVIALYLRSKLKDVDAQNKHSWETFPEEQDGRPEGEIGYVRMLNGVLPKDTRIVGWCPVPSDFAKVLNINSITIFHVPPGYGECRFKGHQLCAIKIKGSAFLCHQVCCMVAVLLMIGQALESPDAGTISKQHSACIGIQ
ncbi:hypothetical protein NC651_014048 [Populus alba x Populus x berolinensis]|nr:hypothetical protein NC651_014048 [Populus alba x Populus x berolinensis]